MPSGKCGPEDLFTCQMCGECCRGYGGTVVGDHDIDAIAAYLRIDANEFRTRYCIPSGDKTILAQGADGYCVFWKRLCTIHPVKPRMCRAWPFIESVLVDPANWRIMAGSCPGMRKDPTDAEIQLCVRQQLLSRCG
jgi:Fe-S-cluster containining protein